MQEEELRQRAADLESRLRAGLVLSRAEQILLLTAYLVLARTRRELKYGHA